MSYWWGNFRWKKHSSVGVFIFQALKAQTEMFSLRKGIAIYIPFRIPRILKEKTEKNWMNIVGYICVGVLLLFIIILLKGSQFYSYFITLLCEHWAHILFINK